MNKIRIYHEKNDTGQQLRSYKLLVSLNGKLLGNVTHIDFNIHGEEPFPTMTIHQLGDPKKIECLIHQLEIEGEG